MRIARLDSFPKLCNVPADLKRRSTDFLTIVRAMAGSLLIAGCGAVSPKNRITEAELPTPESWHASPTGRAGVDSDWVGRFKDSRLRQLIDQAFHENRDLRASIARYDQALQQVRIAGAAALPYADLSFDANRQKQNFIGFPIGGQGAEGGGGEQNAVFSNIFNQFNLNLGAQWEIDVWGRIRAGQSAALADAEAASQDIRAARASLAARVASAWFSIAEENSQVRLARETEAAFQSTADTVRDRFARGQQAEGGSASQVRLAETDVATARAARLEREQNLDSARRRLEILIGSYPAGRINTATLPPVPAKPPVGLPSELLQRRPDVLAAERRFAAAGKRLSEARRAVFPRLTLTSGGGTATGELSELLNSDFGVWQIAGNVVQPIFTGGQILAEARTRSAREREALASLQQTVLDAFGEVESALAAERLLAERAAAVETALKLAREADEAARADFAGGLGDFLTVLTAQNSVVRLRSQQLTLHRLRLENRINLHLALGGDFEVHPAP